MCSALVPPSSIAPHRSNLIGCRSIAQGCILLSSSAARGESTDFVGELLESIASIKVSRYPECSFNRFITTTHDINYCSGFAVSSCLLYFFIALDFDTPHALDFAQVIHVRSRHHHIITIAVSPCNFNSQHLQLVLVQANFKCL